MTIQESIKILTKYVKLDREARNNSTESDFDKFCEEKMYRNRNIN